jgi:apolipoprotein N-acyltransferase
LSLLIIASNIWVFYCICNRHYKRSILAGLVPLLLGLYGYQSLSEEPHILNPRLADISLVQPSVEQTKKWDDKYFNHVLNLTYDVMNSANLDSGDLIILAETAIPEFIQKRRPAVYTEFHYMARKYHSDIIVGSLDYEPNNHPSKTHNFYNSAFMFPSDTARRVKQYSKLHLVPFSERLPFDNIFPILNYVDLGEGDFSPGEGIMIWGRGFKYSPTICYEVVYPSFIREIRKTGAELIVNITNDGWFGRSTAPYQHLNICRFRAVEAGMPIARCSNSGISAFIDYKGRYLGRTRLMEKTVLRKKIPLITKDTLYQKMGALFEGVLFWFWVIVNALAGISFVTGRYSGKILRRNIRL